MAQDSTEQDDENDHLDDPGAGRPSNAQSATIHPLPSFFIRESEVEFGSPVSKLEAGPELLAYNFDEDEAPSTDGRLGCFFVCELRSGR